MHPLTTNKTAPTLDVLRFGFESAGALEIANEYSGLAKEVAKSLESYNTEAGATVPFQINVGKATAK